MIEQIFLPEKIGDRYLFSKQIVGIEIRKAELLASKVTLQGNSTTLESCIQEPLTAESGATHQERVHSALQALLPQLGRYDTVHTCLPNSVVVFKELQLPFCDPDKIKMALPFEVEGLLPFPLKEASLDFIITAIHPESGQTTVLVAAVQHQQIAEHLALFAESGITPDTVTVDFFALYGLYKEIPAYAQLTHGVVLISLDTNNTRIGYVYNGALKLIRTINHGVSQIAQAVGEKTDQSSSEVIEKLVRFGTTTNNIPPEALDTALLSWWRAIEITLTSFAAQTADEQIITQLLLLGTGAQIKGIPDFITKQFDRPCDLFDASQITKTGVTLAKKKMVIPPNTIISVGAALPTSTTRWFNLQITDTDATDDTLFLKQLGTASVLVFLILGSLCMHLVIQRYKLSSELADSQQEAITELQERFETLRDEEPEDLDDAIAAARSELNQGQDIWFRFGPEKRAAQYLVALTNLIDREKLGFVADQISLQGDTITLKASVRDHDALVPLENALRESKTFRPLDSPSDPKFTMKILVPALSKREA